MHTLQIYLGSTQLTRDIKAMIQSGKQDAYTLEFNPLRLNLARFILARHGHIHACKIDNDVTNIIGSKALRLTFGFPPKRGSDWSRAPSVSAHVLETRLFFRANLTIQELNNVTPRYIFVIEAFSRKREHTYLPERPSPEIW